MKLRNVQKRPESDINVLNIYIHIKAADRHINLILFFIESEF